jgi:hypothetical protein
VIGKEDVPVELKRGCGGLVEKSERSYFFRELSSPAIREELLVGRGQSKMPIVAGPCDARQAKACHPLEIR